MRLKILVIVLLAACSCGKKRRSSSAAKAEAAKAEAAKPEVPTAAQAEDDRAWAISSGDGKATLRQEPSGDQCRVTCTTGEGTQAWEGAGTCMGVKSQPRFVAADCERVVVINPTPNQNNLWSATEVMRVYSRNQLEHSVWGASVIAETALGPSRSWLKGSSAEAPGQEPRYASDGRAVEFETADGKAHSISLVIEPTTVAENTATKVSPPKRAASAKPHRKGKRHR